VKTNTANSWLKHGYERFFDFLDEQTDRYSFLVNYIESLKLNSKVISVEGNKHIFIFPSEQKPLRTSTDIFPFKEQNPFLLCAHYDRVDGSPGANDNSIGVFHLLNVAVILTKKKINNWLIVFTDKEELMVGESFEMQGSFSLAKKIKTWGLEKAKIYNFDACGIGDTFIISTTTDHILKNSDRPNIKELRKTVNQLRDHALFTANNLRLDKVLLAPTPFSDDAGFLCAGFAAQTVTILPAQEASQYESLLRNRPEFADIIISGKIKEPCERRNLPETWRNLNNVNDSPSRLTPQFFEQTVQFIAGLISSN
jgi:tetrahydromethanopterin S-methyltransferase subunit F